MNVFEIHSVAELQDISPQWDDLWRRSDVNHPTARADLLALWANRFAPAGRFRAIIVEEQGRFLAALPLCNSTIGGVTRSAIATGNVWSPGGELLVDQTIDAAPALRLLAKHLAGADFSVLWLDWVRTESNSNRQLFSALETQGFAIEEQHRLEIGMLEIPNDWEQYMKALSRNHRQTYRKHTRRLQEQGKVAFQFFTNPDDSELEAMLQQGFEVEHRSWKGEAGSSVLATPGMFDFYLQQARQANAWGQLNLSFLETKGRAIAFEYGWTAKGVYQSFKVGYDAAFAKYSPGPLLLGKIIERFCTDHSVHTIDFLGPLTGAIDKWRPKRTKVSRLVAARPGLRGKAFLQGYKTTRACVRQTRHWKTWIGEAFRRV